VAVRDLPGLGFPHGANRGEELLYAFRYAKPVGLAAAFAVGKREPKLTCRVESLVDAQLERVRVRTTIHANVQYAGIDRVRLEVPEALGREGALKFDRAGVKDVQVSEPSEGKAVWTVSLQGSRIGSFPIRFSYDLVHEGFAPGQQRLVPVQEVRVLDCFTETGDIALRKHENVVIDVVDREGIERRDKRELPTALADGGVFQAYRYVAHPWRLDLRVTQYDFRAPMGIQVLHLHQDEVVDKEGGAKAEAVLLVRNASEQVLRVVLPAGAELQRIKVDGKNVASTSDSALDGRPALQIHLGEVTQERGDEPFQVRIRYDLPAEGGFSPFGARTLGTLRFPLDGAGEAGQPAADVPVARFTRSLYLPRDPLYLSFETAATRLWRPDDVWSGLARGVGLGAPTDGVDVYRGAQGASAAVARTKGLAPATKDVYYPHLELPRRRPYLFDSLSGPASVRVVGMSARSSRRSWWARRCARSLPAPWWARRGSGRWAWGAPSGAS
jgi:hypothetical protein